MAGASPPKVSAASAATAFTQGFGRMTILVGRGEWVGISRIGGDGGRVARRTRLSPARHHTETDSDDGRRPNNP